MQKYQNTGQSERKSNTISSPESLEVDVKQQQAHLNSMSIPTMSNTSLPSSNNLVVDETRNERPLIDKRYASASSLKESENRNEDNEGTGNGVVMTNSVSSYKHYSHRQNYVHRSGIYGSSSSAAATSNYLMKSKQLATSTQLQPQRVSSGEDDDYGDDDDVNYGVGGSDRDDIVMHNERRRENSYSGTSAYEILEHHQHRLSDMSGDRDNMYYDIDAGLGSSCNRLAQANYTAGSSAAQQMAKKPRGELTCVVCGAAANGYNFDAITCESCKAFFRRNAFRPLNLFRCSNNNSCEITVATRKKCKKCRIMKCFNLGMRRDWIMTEVEREEKRRKIAMNKTVIGAPSKPLTPTHISSHHDHHDNSSQDSSFSQSYTSGSGQYPQYNGFSEGEHAAATGVDMSSSASLLNSAITSNKPVRRRRRRRRQGALAPATQLPSNATVPPSVPQPQPHNLIDSTCGTSLALHHATNPSNQIPSSSNKNYNSTSHDYNMGSYVTLPSYTQKHANEFGSTSSYYDPSLHDEEDMLNKLQRKRKSPQCVENSGNASVYHASSKSTSSASSLSTNDDLANKNDPDIFRLGLLEQYKICNRDKIVVDHDVELKTKVTELERNQVEAILEAYKQAIKLVRANGIPKTSEDINQSINLTELGVRRLIFFFKLISDFRNLDHDLMVKLLKKNMMNLIQIHGVNSYNKKEDTFQEPDSGDTPFSASSLELIYGSDIYKLTIGITQNLYDLCNGDMTYIKILLLIVLFDPINDQLTDGERSQIVKLQNKYVTLLHAYMCDNFGKDKGYITFKSIIYEMNKVNDLAQWFERTVAEKSDYDNLRPLMKEVLSLPTTKSQANSGPPSSAVENSTPPASVTPSINH